MKIMIKVTIVQQISRGVDPYNTIIILIFIQRRGTYDEELEHVVEVLICCILLPCHLTAAHSAVAAVAAVAAVSAVAAVGGCCGLNGVSINEIYIAPSLKKTSFKRGSLLRQGLKVGEFSTSTFSTYFTLYLPHILSLLLGSCGLTGVLMN